MLHKNKNMTSYFESRKINLKKKNPSKNKIQTNKFPAEIIEIVAGMHGSAREPHVHASAGHTFEDGTTV